MGAAQGEFTCVSRRGSAGRACCVLALRRSGSVAVVVLSLAVPGIMA